ncbi:proline--tRNA ligase [Pontiella sulfatireligans]|uniref:Proline--tRNA ligase n=1 Tax=Pontiella sulfatireligans TaxID=2750658 RepID=A0A6C2UVA9_9BACT|nr:proline--tRNA ligase [Pontiella sulfatireligans]VGO23331.1 Proline--tRNA ligase [Pontiella sulfatireligans]
MAKQKKTAVTPTRDENYPEWYQQVVRAAELAENSDVRGCMVIKPWGYALWENIQRGLDKMFKDTGHVNAYFPLFIPLSYLEKEAEHVDGFAKECAVVTHHRLEQGDDGKLHPAGELEEPLIVRPTSETIIGATYAKWVESYRDLPILINQWANVVRWEMRTRLFLRTAEFLWQEGHTAHETEAEALEETRKMLDVYQTFAEEFMAMPVLIGEKTAGERFPGAVNTLCIEAMMQDRKALQAGTSHFLGQNFAKASGIQYSNRDGAKDYAWTTSWGVSTRLIGGMIMTHGDDDGMIMPPRLAPSHVVILPIIRNEEDRESILAYCNELASKLREKRFHERDVEVVVDARDINAGEKGWSWVKKGIPVRAEVGPRDMANNSVFMVRRDTGKKEGVDKDAFVDGIVQTLEDIQQGLLQRALEHRAANTKEIDSYDEFVQFFTPENKNRPEAHGGFAMSHWCDAAECEDKINDELSVTIRTVPFDRAESGAGECICCGKPSAGRVVFAKSY